MSKWKFVRGNLRRRDYKRVVLTETAPYEMPLIVSNDGFYKNLVDIDLLAMPNREIVDKLIINKLKYTIPFKYKIAKDADSIRELSLLHPASQYAVAAFYDKYDTLIHYYCSIGSFSLRRPVRNGAAYFFRSEISEANKYKNNKINMEDIDRLTRNPASFFVYAGVQRLYKFFESYEFLRMERKYSRMCLVDVSKCFNSIYTHTISWAVKSKGHAKSNKSEVSFGSEFDGLITSANYGETNGIPIGPELSRIFAEIIFNRIDFNIAQQAAEIGLNVGIDFDVRRYVDDFILFSNKEDIEIEVRKIIEERLTEYNMHLSATKTETFSRPFLTLKSHIISATKEKLSEVFEGVTEKKSGLLIPKRVVRPNAFLRFLINSIKSVCREEAAGYDMVASYVISSLIKWIERLVRDYPEAMQQEVDPSLYPHLLLRLLEGALFFYAVNPSVASSFNIGRGIILSWRFLEKNFPDEKIAAAEMLQRLVAQLARDHRPKERFEHRSKIHVELLNVILASCVVRGPGELDENTLRGILFTGGEVDYFSIVSGLFYIGSNSRYSSVKKELELAILTKLGNCGSVLHRSQDAHLVLDALACPHLSYGFRADILLKLRAALGLSARTRLELETDVTQFEASPWFVQWERVDILNLIQKKELSSVY